MVTFAQAQERAERWVNGSVDAEHQREVRVREFDLGFVAWAEDQDGNPSGCGRLVIARESGETTLWPTLPVNEVIRHYEAEYGGQTAPAAEDQAAPSVDLEATSFLLTPPQWLQEAADRAGIPDQRSESRASDAEPDTAEPAAPAADDDAGTASDAPAADGGQEAASPWDATDTSRSGVDAPAMDLPATVVSAPVVEQPPQDSASGDDPEARTAVIAARETAPSGWSTPPPPPPPSDPPGAPATPAAETPRGPEAADPSPPDGGDATGGGAYVATQTVPAAVPPAPADGNPAGGPPPSPPTGGGAHDAATMLAAPPPAGSGAPPPPSAPGTPAPPPPPGAPGTPGAPPGGPDRAASGAHDAATVLAAAPVVGPPGAPPAPPGGAAPSTPPPPAAPGTPPPNAGPGTPPGSGAYGYPQQPAQPVVGSGYMAVLRYRGADGTEQRLIRRSAPGMPHPEWQLLHELYGLGVPPQQVIELHTELQSCEVPGGYCARMIRETWPQVRITHTASYGADHATRQAGVRHLVEHQDELEQYADGPPRNAPVRAPLAPQQTAPAVGFDVIGQELAQEFGPQGVFRYDQHSASRQGVPEVVGQSLVWAGVPLGLPPFFWGQGQPGRPIPTLAELAQERGVAPAPDAGSYLVVGNDFGRQLCVQYGTAYIVAVPLEAGPGGQAVAPQFVNASLPQFQRSLAMLARMWRLRLGLTPEQAGRWTSDFQVQLATLDGQALADPENWWSVLLEQMWDGLL